MWWPFLFDQAGEAQCAARVERQFSKVSPALLHYATYVLFRDWLRPDLAPEIGTL